MQERLKRHLFLITTCALVIVCTVMWAMAVRNIRTAAEPSYNFENIRTDSDAVRFFAQFGWRIDQKRVETENITIPEDFDNVYREYNKLQKKVGLDLEKYKGKTLERRTYNVLNHPKSDEMQVRGNILLYDGRVVAGDIMSVNLDGFMQPLVRD